MGDGYVLAYQLGLAPDLQVLSIAMGLDTAGLLSWNHQCYLENIRRNIRLCDQFLTFEGKP